MRLRAEDPSPHTHCYAHLRTKKSPPAGTGWQSPLAHWASKAQSDPAPRPMQTWSGSSHTEEQQQPQPLQGGSSPFFTQHAQVTGWRVSRTGAQAARQTPPHVFPSQVQTPSRQSVLAH